MTLDKSAISSMTTDEYERLKKWATDMAPYGHVMAMLTLKLLAHCDTVREKVLLLQTELHEAKEKLETQDLISNGSCG